MGCVASKLEEDEEVVCICKERKRLLKLVVDRRYTLAEAHCKYNRALFAVAAAIRLFVARHSTHSPPNYLILPPPTPQNDANPMFLQQRPSESTIHEAIACESCTSSTTSSDEEEEEGGKQRMVKGEEPKPKHEQEQGCGYFYMPPPMASPQRDYGGWDYFNPFDDMRPEEIIATSYQRSCDEDLRVVREQEGIPELEDEEEEEKKVVIVQEKKKMKKKMNKKKSKKENVEDMMNVVVGDDESCDVGKIEKKGLTVIDTPEEGRELLDALKDIQDYFIRAYDSGKDVSRMLEANMVPLQSGLEEVKENSTKLIQAIKWHRSTSAKPSSCKSLVASGSKSSSTWTEFRNDLFDDYGGMDSGSHSLTLGRLYAWEKKLFEEVQAGDIIRKIYEKKCARLRSEDVKGYDEDSMDKTRAVVKDLYARILVAIRSAESISLRIQKLRDEELQPQILELLKGLTRNWRIMLESHETQNKILFEVKTFACSAYGKFCNDSHRLATLQLYAELRAWRECFMEYIAAQKLYVEALYSWLTKFLVPEVELYSKGRRSSTAPPPCRVNGPPLLVICHDWLASIQKLPDKSVALALKSFSKDVDALWVQEGEEQKQKRKVESVTKELDRKNLAFQKTETRYLEFTEQKPEFEMEMENRATEQLEEKKEQLDAVRNKLEVEKEKHYNYIQETQRMTLNGLQTGFSNVFESLVEFSKASLKMYNDLVSFSENTEKSGSQSFIEGSQVEENTSR